MDSQRLSLLRPLLIVAMLLLTPLGLVSDLMAQDPELEDLGEYSYEYYYPKRAKGEQPTAWHVPDFDNINLFNGNLTMQIPLGPPLQPGGDLTWQPVLYYNSKIWTDNRRDDRADPTNGHPYHADGIENRGYLDTDRTAGLGWRLAAPFLHLKRVKREQYGRSYPELLNLPHDVQTWYNTTFATACPNKDACVIYLVDSIVMPDGSRHSLRPSRDGWEVETPPGDTNTTWYSADGSGWKVTRIDRSPPASPYCPIIPEEVPNDVLDMYDIFIGEKDGLRYTFAFPFFVDIARPVNQQARETDFVSGTRGWYCTKIESMRWPGMSIDFSYFEVNSPSSCIEEGEGDDPPPAGEDDWSWKAGVGDLDAPIISKIEAKIDTATVQKVTVTTSTHTGTFTDIAFPDITSCESTYGDEDITVIDSLTISAFDDTGAESELLTYDFEYLGEGTPSGTLYAIPISGKSRADINWATFSNDPDYYTEPYSRPPGWDSLRSHTHPFPLLQQLIVQSPGSSIDPLVWSFEYDWTTKWGSENAPTPDQSSCSMVEAAYIAEGPDKAATLPWKYLYTSDDRTGLVSRVGLPNGTNIDYRFNRWMMVKQEFAEVPGRIKHDDIYIDKVGGGAGGKATESDKSIPFMGRLIYRDRSVTAGVNRRLVTDADGTTLELTEYIHGGFDSPHMVQMPDWDPTVSQFEDFWDYMASWNLMMDLSDEAFAGPKYGFPFDFEGIPNGAGDPFPDDPTEQVAAGYSQTVVRRHLIADASPPANADSDDLDLSDITITTDLPSYRFDDTVHVFANGSFFYDVDGDTLVSPGDHFGNLPLSGRPLQVRYYRGSSMCRGDLADCSGEEFFWWKPTIDGIGEQNLLRVERYQYTLPLQESIPPSVEDTGATIQRYPLREICGNHYLEPTGDTFGMKLGYYCDAFPHSVRERRSTTEYLNDDSAMGSRYTAVEHKYETDDEFGELGDDTEFDENRVATTAVDDFLEEKPWGDTWDGSEWTLVTDISYKKDHFDADLEPWFISLVSSQSTTLSPASGSSSSEAVSFAYDCADSRCLLTSKTALANGDGNDVTTWYDYYDTASETDRYGRIRTVTSRSSETVGEPPDEETLYSFDITAFDYEHQKLGKKWKLCASDPSCDGLQEACEGWSTDADAPDWTEPSGLCSGSLSLPAELIGEQTIDVYWRRPTSRVDGNGDGVNIGYDWLGRVTSLDPTDTFIASTELEYPNLRTTLVSIENTDATMTLVARHSFDGLGRISHSAARREATSDNGYGGYESDFRHKVFFYDGTGTTWAESHWHEWQPGGEPEDPGSPLPAPTSMTTVDDHFEKVSVVDPFGRDEQAISSTGGQTLSTYLGEQYADQLIKDLDPVAEMSRTVTRTDARGNLVKSWEAKAGTALTTTLSGTIETTLDDTLKFVRSEYSYDIGKRLLDVTVTGRDAASAEVSQVRSFDYDGLGNLTLEAYPELGIDNWIEYSDYDVRGEPRLVVYKKAGGTVDTALYHDRDAAGRALTTWFKNGDSWMVYSANYWGTDTAGHEVGKLVQSTQYNLMHANTSACSSNQVEAEGSIAVSQVYTYGGPLGMASERLTDISVGCDGGEGSLQLSLDYGYDIWGNTNKIKYPHWAQGPECGLPPRPEVSYTWDTVGGLSQIDLTQGLLTKQLMHTIQYDEATGMMTGWQTPAGLHGATSDIVHVVDTDGTRARPLSISASVGGSSIFDSGDYEYDVLGNITKLNGSSATSGWDYEYDPLSRLTKTTSGSIQQYEYDDFGNLTSHAGVTQSVSSATNQLNATSYVYDDRGNMESQPMGTWTRQLRYDPGNRVISTWSTPALGEGFFGFAYDAGGERVLKYRLDEAEVIDATLFLRDENGNVLTEYLWIPAEAGSDEGPLMRFSDHVFLGRNEIVTLEPALDELSWTTSYTALVHDHLASTRAEVYDGSSWSAIDFWPYGEFKQVSTLGTGALENNRRYYTGHEREYVGSVSDFSSVEGLDYMHARYYSHNLGRFLNTDVFFGDVSSSQKYNRYSYSWNNPIRIIDPDGLYGRDVHYYFMAYLAASAGVNTGVALQLAEANQGVDDNRPAWKIWKRDDFNQHFMTAAQARANLHTAQNAHNLQGQGAALHSLMDSYSHAGFGWPCGHFFASLLGRGPDNPGRNLASSIRFLTMVFDVINEMGWDPTRINWNFVITFATTRSKEDRMQMAYQAAASLKVQVNPPINNIYIRRVSQNLIRIDDQFVWSDTWQNAY